MKILGLLFTIVDFDLNNRFAKSATEFSVSELDELRSMNIQMEYEHVSLPAQDAFGEGMWLLLRRLMLIVALQTLLPIIKIDKEC